VEKDPPCALLLQLQLASAHPILGDAFPGEGLSLAMDDNPALLEAYSAV